MTQKEKIEIMIDDMVYGFIDGWLEPAQREMIAQECSLATFIGSHFEDQGDNEIEKFYNRLFDQEEITTWD